MFKDEPSSTYKRIAAAFGVVALTVSPFTFGEERIGVVPGPDRNKIIAIYGWSAEETNAITVQFAKMHVHEIETIAELKVNVYEDGPVVLSFPAALSAETYYYLINYFHYPHDYDLEGRDITVLGIAYVDSTFDVDEKGVTFFYVPTMDTDFDTLYAETTDGQSFRIPFHYEFKLSPLSWKPFTWTEVADSRQTDTLRDLISSAKDMAGVTQN